MKTIVDRIGLPALLDHCKTMRESGVCHAAAAAEIIDRQPTIDPESLRPRGRWKDACYYHDCPLCYECSHCGLKLMYKPNYCPHCGAKMEES